MKVRTLVAACLVLTTLLAGCGDGPKPVAIEDVHLGNDLCSNGIQVSFSVRNISGKPIADATATARLVGRATRHEFPPFELTLNQTRSFKATLPFQDNCFLDQPKTVEVAVKVPGGATVTQKGTVRT